MPKFNRPLPERIAPVPVREYAEPTYVQQRPVPVSEQIRAIAARKNISGMKAEKWMGIKHNRWNAWLRGECTFGYEKLDRIAEFLRLNIFEA